MAGEPHGKPYRFVAPQRGLTPENDSREILIQALIFRLAFDEGAASSPRTEVLLIPNRWAISRLDTPLAKSS